MGSSVYEVRKKIQVPELNKSVPNCARFHPYGQENYIVITYFF